MLLNWLEKVIHKLISVDQAAYIKVRSLSDHVLVAQEIFNKFRWSKAKGGFLAIKLNMEQAYDSMGWDALRQILSDALCLRVNRGISISRLAPKVSHFLFADDILIFSEAKVKEVKELRRIINNYYDWTGQMVNQSKSMILFGNNTRKRVQKKMMKILKFKKVKEFNYPGIKMALRRLKTADSQNLLEAAAGRLNTWGSKNISLEGRIVLVKSAFLSLPLFMSSLTLVPLRILKDFDKMCRSFLWSKADGNVRIHYVSWELLCKPKCEGGRGLFSAVSKVGPLRTKFAWRFFSNPNSVLNHILKAKYEADIWSSSVRTG
ncbi:uncharacterized protein LOC110104049, partial [Dendrobium catenatum]|uniref:uncharacterized protein LOC110104049 n=1 Tax=Dendrobium catenatum TaxID=906689 RepID=UPI0009F54FB0